MESVIALSSPSPDIQDWKWLTSIAVSLGNLNNGTGKTGAYIKVMEIVARYPGRQTRPEEL